MTYALNIFFLILSSNLFCQSWDEMKQLTEEYYNQGNYVACLDWAQKSVLQAEKEFGKKHVNYAHSLNNLGFSCEILTQYEEAESNYKQGLEIYAEVFCKENTKYATTLKNLASLYSVLGKYDEADSLYIQSLTIIEKIEGKENFAYLSTLNGLANLYSDVGKYDEAKDLYYICLGLKEKLYGKNSASYATTLNNLATLYLLISDYKNGEKLLLDVLHFEETTIPENHLNYAATLNNLGYLYKCLRDFEKAEEYYVESLLITEEALGNKHPGFATRLFQLGSLYEMLGKYDEAELLLVRSMEIRKKLLGKNHPDYGAVLSKFADLYRSLGHYEKAISNYHESLEIIEKKFGKDHPDYARKLNDLGFVYESVRQFERAADCYLVGLKITEKQLGKESFQYGTNLYNLGRIFELTDSYEKAEQCYLRCLRIYELQVGRENPDFAIVLNVLARMMVKKGNFEQAELFYQECLRIFNQSYELFHPYITTGLATLADLYVELKQYEKAEPLFLRANNLLLNQIKKYFSFLSENEKEKFIKRINHRFETFNSFAYKRTFKNHLINAEMYNTQLSIKALLLSSTVKIRRRILNSGDEELIQLYDSWISQKEYLVRVYNLKKDNIARRDLNVDSLETQANEYEKILSRYSEDFAKATDTTLYTWKDIQKALKPGEAAIEMVRFRWFHKTWTDTVFYAALILTPDSQDHPDMVVLTNGNDLEDPDASLEEYQRCVSGVKAPIPYQHYWQPIREKLAGIKKVYFSPDGIYNQINLNILYNSETQKYLVDETDIHSVTNTKDILSFGESQSGNQQAALFGKPRYNLDSDRHESLVAGLRGETLPGNWRSDKEKGFLEEVAWKPLIGTKEEINKIENILKKEELANHGLPR